MDSVRTFGASETTAQTQAKIIHNDGSGTNLEDVFGKATIPFPIDFNSHRRGRED